MTDFLFGEVKGIERDYTDIDCGCGQENCPYCNPKEPTFEEWLLRKLI